MARILLVDDERDQLELRRMILERLGHEVSAAATAEEAEGAAGLGRLEAVVMDLNLPRAEDGLALLGRIPRGLPVIVLTGAALAGPVPGAFRTLRKPCPTGALVQAIEEATERDGDPGSRHTEERAD